MTTHARTINPKAADDEDKRVITGMMQEMHNKLVLLTDVPHFSENTAPDGPDIPLVMFWGSGPNYPEYMSVAVPLDSNKIKFSVADYVRSQVTESQPEAVAMATPAYARTGSTPEESLLAERREIIMLYCETKTGAVGSSVLEVTRNTGYKIGPLGDIDFASDKIQITIGDFYDLDQRDW